MTEIEKDRDVLARTLLGEAGGESLAGQIAVAWTIRNRVNDGQMVDRKVPDLTGGATHYYASTMAKSPVWVKGATQTLKLGWFPIKGTTDQGESVVTVRHEHGERDFDECFVPVNGFECRARISGCFNPTLPFNPAGQFLQRAFEGHLVFIDRAKQGVDQVRI